MPNLRIIEDQVAEPVTQTLCEICEKQFSNYVCPRCNLRYCSLACYKHLDHGECTESFYKDSVTEEIKNRDIDKDSKIKMLEVLKRLEEDNRVDEEEDSEDDLTDRLAHVDITNADPKELWELLSEKERKEFETILSDFEHTGNSSQLDIPAYQPWWEMDIPKVQEVDREDQDIPSIPKTLPDFEKMTKPAARSSPHLAWNLLSILTTYSYLMRHSLGNLSDDYHNTINILQLLSSDVLYSTQSGCPFGSVDDVITDSIDGIIQIEGDHPLMKTSSSKLYDIKCMLLSDLQLLLKERVRAISHFWTILNEIKQHYRLKNKPFTLAIHKLYFYLGAACYLDSQRQDILLGAIGSSLSRTRLERDRFLQEKSAAEEAMKKSKSSSNKVIIEPL